MNLVLIDLINQEKKSLKTRSVTINFLSRCQMQSTIDHLLFDSQFESGNLRKAIQVKPYQKSRHFYLYFLFLVHSFKIDY